MLRLLSLLLTVFSFFNPSMDALTINLISRDLFNQAGKEVDVRILESELEGLGHSVHLYDYTKGGHLPSADINLFLAQFKSSLFLKAKLNWLLVNPDFYMASVNDLKKFDLILCKTEESLRIFQALTPSSYYLGFTSIDCYDPLILKDFTKHLHVAGKSVMKGTEQVLLAWSKHPKLPKLIMIKRDAKDLDVSENMELITKRVPRESLLKMQNQCGIHVCPSKTEGFGHYMMEPMSAGCVVITTDAPPMNEFIKDKRCLVGYTHTGHQNLAVTYFVDDEALADKVKSLQKLPEEELFKIGEKNREEYLKKRDVFKGNLRRLLKKTERYLSKELSRNKLCI